MLKKERLKHSILFEARASYNLLQSAPMAWLTLLMVLSAFATPLFLAQDMPFAAVLFSITAVITGRYLFFVSVVPLNMALTFVRARQA
jgi:formate dehydrogenase iron-sulfur subunit